MKNRPDSVDVNCCNSVMLPRASTMAPVTWCTIPGRSGQDRVSSQWVESITAERVASSTPLIPPLRYSYFGLLPEYG